MLLSPWASGARSLQIPELRAAYSAAATGDREWKVFANILASVASSFKDADFVQMGTEAFLKTTSPLGLFAFNTATERIDITDLLPRVMVPTLVIHEPAFPFGSFELCQEVAAGIPDAEFITVTDNSIAGRVHDANIAAIDRFLRAGRATGSTSSAFSDAPATLTDVPNGLTPREVQVLRQVAAGSTNKAIASELGVAVSRNRR